MTRKQRTTLLSYATPKELDIINNIKEKCKQRMLEEKKQQLQQQKLNKKIHVLRAKIKQMQEEEQQLLVRQYEINYKENKND